MTKIYFISVYSLYPLLTLRMVRSPHCACPHARSLFTLLGKKWVIFILQAIDEGATTFTEIRHAIGEANTKILTDRLSELVESHIITKSESGNYTLTSRGQELSERLVGLARWWGEES